MRTPELREFVLHSPAAAIAGRLTRSREARILHDHFLVKEPGTLERTPWHHDQPCCCVGGTQVCSIWMPIHLVPRDTCLEFVAGSHRWGLWFMPRRFVDHRNYDCEPGAYPSVPDIDGAREKHPIRSWSVEPGDCLVFHALTLRGAPGNPSLERRRRTLSTRWVGDDAVYARRPGVTSPPFPELTLQPGDPMDCELFPAVWRQGRRWRRRKPGPSRPSGAPRERDGLRAPVRGPAWTTSLAPAQARRPGRGAAARNARAAPGSLASPKARPA